MRCRVEHALPRCSSRGDETWDHERGVVFVRRPRENVWGIKLSRGISAECLIWPTFVDDRYCVKSNRIYIFSGLGRPRGAAWNASHVRAPLRAKFHASLSRETGPRSDASINRRTQPYTTISSTYKNETEDIFLL